MVTGGDAKRLTRDSPTRLDMPDLINPPAPARAPKPSNAPANGRRLLIVDDEENIRTPLSVFLRSRGYEVQTAESGARALALLGEQKFTLMLCDIRMPGLSGVEVVPHGDRSPLARRARLPHEADRARRPRGGRRARAAQALPGDRAAEHRAHDPRGSRPADHRARGGEAGTPVAHRQRRRDAHQRDGSQ